MSAIIASTTGFRWPTRKRKLSLEQNVKAYRLAWQVTKRCCWVGHSQRPESKLRHSGIRLFDPCSRELRSNTKGNHRSQKDTLPE